MISELERIEKETGRTYTTHDANLVCEKAATRPGDLTTEDFAVIAFFRGARAAGEARAAREMARNPKGQAPAQIVRTGGDQGKPTRVMQVIRDNKGFIAEVHERIVSPPQAAAAATAPPHNVKFPDKLWDADAPDQVAEMERWANEQASTAVPTLIWWDFVSRARELREKLAAKVEAVEKRNARLETLEAEVAELRTRIGDSKTCDRCAAHENRIAELEARPSGLPYRGTWKTETPYGKGDLATHDGSIWHANALTYSRPGTDSTWTLAVKHGRNARS